jgi:hypothetical protein
LKDLVFGQAKINENISKNLAVNDKILENINNKIDSFSSAMKNQLSFNKILESQIAQLASAIPSTKKGKILGQPEEPKTVNIIEIKNLKFYTEPSHENWRDDSMPEKKGDFGHPVIPINIGPHEFDEVICDLGASINVMPKVIYDHILQFDTLLYTTMRVQLAN